jgi:DnaJ-class molecular chaperone
MEASGDYYGMLGVRPDADAAAIRRAYRDLIRRHHPDVNLSSDAADISSTINEAYACLRDPVSREEHDRRHGLGRFSAEAIWGAPMQPFQPSWGNQQADLLFEEALVQSKPWRVAAVALAMVATVITFTLTSAVEQVEPAPVHIVLVPTEAPAQAPAMSGSITR